LFVNIASTVDNKASIIDGLPADEEVEAIKSSKSTTNLRTSE